MTRSFFGTLFLSYLFCASTFISANDNLSLEGFAADTEILVPGGTPTNPLFKKISELKLGDYVCTIDTSGDIVSKPVTFFDFNSTDDYFEISLLDRPDIKFCCGKEQLFFGIQNLNWVAAQDFCGDITTVTACGPMKLSRKRMVNKILLYTIHVQDTNNFFVSKHFVLTHNFGEWLPWLQSKFLEFPLTGNLFKFIKYLFTAILNLIVNFWISPKQTLPAPPIPSLPQKPAEAPLQENATTDYERMLGQNARSQDISTFYDANLFAPDNPKLQQLLCDAQKGLADDEVFVFGLGIIKKTEHAAFLKNMQKSLQRHGSLLATINYAANNPTICKEVEKQENKDHVNLWKNLFNFAKESVNSGFLLLFNAYIQDWFDQSKSLWEKTRTTLFSTACMGSLFELNKTELGMNILNYLGIGTTAGKIVLFGAAFFVVTFIVSKIKNMATPDIKNFDQKVEHLEIQNQQMSEKIDKLVQWIECQKEQTPYDKNYSEQNNELKSIVVKLFKGEPITEAEQAMIVNSEFFAALEKINRKEDSTNNDPKEPHRSQNLANDQFEEEFAESAMDFLNFYTAAQAHFNIIR